MKNVFLLFMLAFCMTLSFSLFSKDARSANRSPQSKVKYKDNTTMDFEGRSLEGDVMNPDGSAIDGDSDVYFDSLVDDRKSFTKELKRSSGAL